MIEPSGLTELFDLPGPITCRLLRSYTNDVYEVTSAEGHFVLKMYRDGWRMEGEIRYELDLLRHLAAKGLAVAGPVRRPGHDDLKRIDAADGPRWAALFSFAPGEKPRPPFMPALYRAFGRAIGRMHALSDDFVSPHPRRPLDLSLLIDEPLALVAPLVADADDRRFLTDLAARVRKAILELDAEGLDRGPIHGDATLDNLHMTAAGEIVLYDFDSGGPGWRAADLQGWAAAGGAEYTEKWDAFRGGYQEIRPLAPADLRAAPYLTIAWDFWGMKIDLDHRILRAGPERTDAYLREQIGLLRERERTLLRGHQGNGGA
jgi:Ser/Thr protein kinase RdoA (MazF antagonist)